MRIVLYVNASGAISGAERSLLSLLDALDRSAWRPVVAAPAGVLLQEAAARGAETVALPLGPLPRPRTLLQGVRTLRAWHRGRRMVTSLVQHWRPALLHANTTPAMLYAASARVPSIWQMRDLVPLGIIGPDLYRRATRVAAISSAVREDLQRYARDGGRKITLLPPAVDTKAFHPAEDRNALRARLGLPPTVPLIGLIAQFVPWKRHHLFLDALAQLGDRPWHAVLAGADLHGDAAYLSGLRERLAQSPFAGRVSWLPWQTDPAALMASLDVCVLTSQREPFGRVLIEAMACGVPAVAVDDGGVRDIVTPGETGLLTPANPAALSSALVQLLDDTALRARLGRAGRVSVEEHFSLTRQRSTLAALYASVLNETSNRSC